MICKDNQEIIDRLLRLKTDSNDGDNNKIASYQYGDWKKRKAKETQCVNLISSIMDQHNEENNNKIASVQSDTGEVTLAEFVKLLRSVIPSS